MHRASFLEVPAHVFGLRLKNPTIFPLRMAQGAFLECGGRVIAPYPAISPGSAFSERGSSITISGGGRRSAILIGWLGEAFFRPLGGATVFV